MITGMRNRHRGIVIDPATLASTADAFGAELDSCIAAWEREGLEFAWLEVPADCSELIPVAVAAGFEFHHCRVRSLVMVKRLRPLAYVPAGATHTIGSGGVVLSEDREVLVVLEHRDADSRPGHFKLPGGMLEPREHLAEGTVREVLEETGVETRFQGVVGLRHHHQGQFGTSNLYFACLLQPTSRTIRVDAREIAQAKWVPVDDYLADDDTGAYNKRVVRAALSGRTLGPEPLEGYMEPGAYEVFV